MKANRKYRVACSGSGWGIWKITGEKVVACKNRFDALSKWYELEGWAKPATWY
jgi:hypothetical protein